MLNEANWLCSEQKDTEQSWKVRRVNFSYMHIIWNTPIKILTGLKEEKKKKRNKKEEKKDISEQELAKLIAAWKEVRN